MTAAVSAGAAMMLAGCSGADESRKEKTAAKPAAADDSYRLDFEAGGRAYTAEHPVATYFSSDNGTSVVGGADDQWTLLMDFEGKGPGTFQGSASLLFATLQSYGSDDVSITVTSYGDVRGTVEGTFSGTLTSSLDPSDTIEITSGTFAAWRSPNFD